MKEKNRNLPGNICLTRGYNSPPPWLRGSSYTPWLIGLKDICHHSSLCLNNICLNAVSSIALFTFYIFCMKHNKYWDKSVYPIIEWIERNLETSIHSLVYYQIISHSYKMICNEKYQIPNTCGLFPSITCIGKQISVVK